MLGKYAKTAIRRVAGGVDLRPLTDFSATAHAAHMGSLNTASARAPSFALAAAYAAGQDVGAADYADDGP